VMVFFLIPMIAFSTEQLVRQGSPLLRWFPGYWFIGLYEQLRPVTGSALLRGLGNSASLATGIAAAVFVATFLPGYRRLARRAVETPALPAAGPGMLRRWTDTALRRTLLRHPAELAVFRFITQSLTRSTKHRLFLATYAGFGAAVAVLSLGSGRQGLVTLPLSLSFVLISGLRAAFNFPSELKANWAFQIGELFPVRHYLAATRKWIVACAIVPLFALLSAMEFACFAWPAAVFHLVFGVLLSLLLAEAMFAGLNKVPFTCAHLPGKVNLVFLGVIYIFGFTMYSRTMARLEVWLLDRPLAAALFFAGCMAVLWAAAHWRSETRALDYEDRADPVIHSLGLSPE
jgi:hypothetical protein